ncbi:MAG: hypothetical protein WBY22_09980 [Nitrososphaeraceae archaeon]
MITVVIAFLPIIFNPISADTVNEPGPYNEPRWIDVYGTFMINKESFDQYVLYFRQIDLFSDLSRNTTSSPSSSPSSNDLFESEEDPEIQDNTGSDLEIEGLQDGSTSDVNQTSSPSSNDLFESEKNTEVQSDIETNMKLNSENEVSIQESEANRDNMPNSSLINP